MKHVDKMSGKPKVPSGAEGGQSFSDRLTAKALVDDDLWLDFVEAELDQTFEDDLSVLLMNSQSDKRNMTNIRTLRDLIKSSDDVYLPEDGRVYDRMHANIMSAIADKRPGADFHVSVRSQFLRHFPSLKFTAVIGAPALAALVAVAGWFSLSKQVPNDSQLQAARVAQVEAEILVAGAETNSIGAEVLDIASEDEFVVDAASRKVASMSDQDYQALLQHLRD